MEEVKFMFPDVMPIRNQGLFNIINLNLNRVACEDLHTMRDNLLKEEME